MSQAIPQLYFKLLFLFPTHCSQQPLPRAGWPLINREYPSPACSGWDAPANRMFVPLAGQGKGNLWNDLVKKKNCFFWQSPLDSPWAVVWWFYLHQENPSKQAALGYQDALSFQHIFAVYQSLDLCLVVILQSCEWKALQLWAVCFLSSPSSAFPGTVSTASYQINTSKFVLSWFNSLQTTAPPGPFLVLAMLLCSLNPCPLYK